MDKVKLPREVAEAIEHCKNHQFTNRVLMRIHMVDDGLPVKGVHQKALQSVDTDVLMQALVNGYEVEQTPEEKVKEYYKKLIKNAVERDEVKHSVNHHRIEMQGIINTLKLLNIKIEGVND